ncbi:hypothetical protein GUA87_07680 [Sneathiella sp. P13V-1]|nr:hypothetical protein [Sneathiella sp. P13V-1]
MRKLFDFAGSPNFAPRYNIPPTTKILAVRLSAKDKAKREAFMPQWGLIPPFAKDTSVAVRMINARSESVSEKPSFRSPFRKRRCLIPADGFYEWQKQPDGKKQPFYFTSKDNHPLAFAGLWEQWDGGEQGMVESCTILTTKAPSYMENIHHRAPVIIRSEDFETWLTGNDAASLPPSDQDPNLKFHSVDRKVGNVKEEGADLIRPAPIPIRPIQGDLF